MKIYKLIPFSIIVLALLITNSAWSAKMYKWVDAAGNISYQDTPPPEGSKIVKEQEIKTTPTSAAQTAQPTEAVTVYTVSDCESCQILMLRLQNWNVPVDEQSLQSREVQARILQLSDSLLAPTVFIGEKMITDLSSSNLSTELQQAGYVIENSASIEETDDATNLDTEN